MFFVRKNQLFSGVILSSSYTHTHTFIRKSRDDATIIHNLNKFHFYTLVNVLEEYGKIILISF